MLLRTEHLGDGYTSNSPKEVLDKPYPPPPSGGNCRSNEQNEAAVFLFKHREVENEQQHVNPLFCTEETMNKGSSD